MIKSNNPHLAGGERTMPEFSDSQTFLVATEVGSLDPIGIQLWLCLNLASLQEVLPQDQCPSRDK